MSDMPDITIIGFDFGLKHIGIAVGQTYTQTAEPLTSIRAVQGEPKWEDISRLLKIWQPQALIVGIPLNMDDSEQPMTLAAKNFAKQLEERYHLRVFCVDERLTSIEARSQLFTRGGFKALQKKAIDSLAAKLIVESWLLNQTRL